jgi:hypothetical protein
MFIRSANTGRITVISLDKKFAHDNGLPYMSDQISLILISESKLRVNSKDFFLEIPGAQENFMS